MNTFTKEFILGKLSELEITDQLVTCTVSIGTAYNEKTRDGMKIVVTGYQNGHYCDPPTKCVDEKHFRLSVFDTNGDFFIKTVDFPASLASELADVMNYCQTEIVSALLHFCHFERWVVDNPESEKTLSGYSGNYYRYLEHVLPMFGYMGPFLPSVKDQLGPGIIIAHGDKTRQYKNLWNSNKVPYLHGCLLHLLSYTSLCNNLEGHRRGDWVIERYHDYLPLIQLAEAEIFSQIMKMVETLRKNINLIKEKF